MKGEKDENPFVCLRNLGIVKQYEGYAFSSEAVNRVRLFEMEYQSASLAANMRGA